MFAQAVIGAAALMAGVAQAQVTATGTMGETNPPQPTMGTAINQTSYSRLLSLNAIDDFCLFGPPTYGDTIGDTEGEQVAWCVQPRNNARVIPDGTFTAVHFVKTPLYWQIQGLGDLTKLNILANDEGGELDPHGATGLGNPVGGNVTTNATGQDVNYEEWMNYMSYNQFCLRICIAENSTYSAAAECQHTLDEMGCQWVMPGDYTDNSFTECDGDAAYPPGLYPQTNGSTSTFQQRYTGTYTDGAGKQALWTQGQTVTPQTAFSTPATSNCKTYTSIGNGIQSLAAAGAGNSTAAATSASQSGSASASATGSASKSGASAVSAASGAGASATRSGASAAGAVSASASGSSSGALSSFSGVNYGPAVAGAFSFVAVLAGAGAFLL
ncbi:hypothetical protein CI109_105104 [Kwoniella shandongensis]|uniref:Uncharacterized protein n=1 Tax=Kwoniella shandongensis TaxID=1734106 RepID=A0A5M6BWI4_9TREE|nr:uncharacterized protein CI109_004296 [Kwoniella shandongensis]KAA5527236.1 hypothetical protein CI109_004296 [Kwoniella shandongensis]